MKIITLLLLATIFTAPFAMAQKKKAVKINFKVTRFDPADRPSPKFSTTDGVDFEVPLHNLSDPIEATLREGTHLDLSNEGKSTSIEIPEGMRKNLLLIFVPNRDSYHVMVVHTALSKLGGGSRLLVNATGSPLGIKYGSSEPLILDHTKRTILSSQRKDAMTPLAVSIKKDDEWKLVRSEKWPNDPRFRSFVFFYKKPGSSRIYVHAIPDRIKTPE